MQCLKMHPGKPGVDLKLSLMRSNKYFMSAYKEILIGENIGTLAIKITFSLIKYKLFMKIVYLKHLNIHNQWLNTVSTVYFIGCLFLIYLI